MVPRYFGALDMGSVRYYLQIITLLGAFSLSSLLPISARAVDKDSEVAVVDVQRVINESIIGRAARKNVEILVSESKVRLASLKASLETQALELKKQGAVLSKSAMDEKASALEKQQLDLQRKYQDLQEEIARRNSEELSKVVCEVATTVEELAEAHRYVAVFENDRRVVVYHSPRLDITNQVIEILDKKKIAL
jgi:outer membrane protein